MKGMTLNQMDRTFIGTKQKIWSNETETEQKQKKNDCERLDRISIAKQKTRCILT